MWLKWQISLCDIQIWSFVVPGITSHVRTFTQVYGLAASLPNVADESRHFGVISLQPSLRAFDVCMQWEGGELFFPVRSLWYGERHLLNWLFGCAGKRYLTTTKTENTDQQEQGLKKEAMQECWTSSFILERNTSTHKSSAKLKSCDPLSAAHARKTRLFLWQGDWIRAHSSAFLPVG